MAEDIESATRIQAVGTMQASLFVQGATNNPSSVMAAAISDALALSPQAQQVMAQLSQGKTVAEAWLDHVTAPPDIGTITKSSDGNATGDSTTGQANGDQSLDSTVKSAMGDISWLLDAIHPPKVNTTEVARVLARRMTLDNVGTAPPTAEVVARAEQSGTSAALYVQGLSATIQNGTVTEASVERVALTTIDPSLRDGTTDNTPVVVDMSGNGIGTPTPNAESVPSAAEEFLAKEEQRRAAAAQAARALLVVHERITSINKGTTLVKLDVVMPLV